MCTGMVLVPYEDEHREAMERMGRPTTNSVKMLGSQLLPVQPARWTTHQNQRDAVGAKRIKLRSRTQSRGSFEPLCASALSTFRAPIATSVMFMSPLLSPPPIPRRRPPRREGILLYWSGRARALGRMSQSRKPWRTGPTHALARRGAASATGSLLAKGSLGAAA